MILDIVAILGGLVLLFVGGDFLVRGSVNLATRMGVSPLFVGLVLVGFGTSAPELFASIEAVRVGAPAIAWGNVVGSNIANVLLVLGAAAAVAAFPIERGPLWRDGGFGLVAAIILFAFAFSGAPAIMGWILLGILSVYLVYAWRSERTHAHSTGAGDRAAAGEMVHVDIPDARPKSLFADIGFTVGGLLLIIFGGNILVAGARDVALILGLSDALVGLTIVAIGTSAPELATSVVAARKGEGGIAFGNVLGSNIYNILGIGGVTALLAPGSLPASMVPVELPLLIAASILMIVFARTGHKFSRWEGFAMLSLYVGYLVWAVLNA
ncbi:calcium/sodium antiporter [Pacificimonas sp. WHA3]|uniref:Calcium/sodium antiporter n=1 Tax=Pacificimonas pallii TaxID=2827236 RepID=A0ABS6SB68_9SPHN|nr:calcium/sodium antiporter [Pacificimonas pallii]MBV7255668.1 calcium/sodium antiporter [Pacificimonas pallii]